jgi:hypothetical protein
MSKYNYYEAVHDDIVTAIFDNYSNEQIVINLRNNEEKFKEMLYDDLFFLKIQLQVMVLEVIR